MINKTIHLINEITLISVYNHDEVVGIKEFKRAPKVNDTFHMEVNLFCPYMRAMRVRTKLMKVARIDKDVLYVNIVSGEQEIKEVKHE